MYVCVYVCMCVCVYVCVCVCVYVCMYVCMYVYNDSLRAGRPGIEPRWERNFPHPSTPALEPTQPPMQGIPYLYPGSTADGAWR
jgi:hypothetical protein